MIKIALRVRSFTYVFFAKYFSLWPFHLALFNKFCFLRLYKRPKDNDHSGHLSKPVRGKDRYTRKPVNGTAMIDSILS